MRILSYVVILAAGNSLLLSNSSLAQTSLHDVSEDQPIEEILTVHPLAERGTSQALTVLTGDELAREVTDSLGETISGQPGIRSSGFGTAVGRPVIHGLGQARVKTTQDRIDTLDVSVTSPDHTVSVEPYIANSITILKGAGTLLYGAGAIGGVVDVDTGRVPTAVPEEALTGRAEARFGDNGDSSVGVFRLDGKFSDNVVFHVDGFTKEADEFEVPDDPDVTLNSDGDLFGSFRESEGGALGISWIGETGLIGVSVSQLDGFYGLLSGEEEEEEGEEGEEAGVAEEEVVEGLLEELQSGVIDLEQTRFDLDARLNQPFAGVKELSVRFGVNDYEHSEIESSGEVGTVFENDAWEARVELKHEAIAGFEGTLGLQLGDREFSAIGAEAFIAPTDSDSIALFWVGERQFNGFDLEAGVRFEEVDHQPVDGSVPALDFSTTSASIGAVVPLNEQTRISGLIDLSSRAPTIEELYSNGPHLATQTFEIGDLSLEEEDAASISVTINHISDTFDITATLYHNEFDGFIYQENIGEIEDGLPVLVYTQDDASFTGLDFEAVLHAYKANNSHLDLGFIYDIVSASLSSSSGVDNRDLPRIPADRAGVYANWFSNAWNLKVEYSRISSQNDTAAFELPTDSYDDLGFSLGRSFQFSDNELTLYLRGRNLTDDVQRNHTSFVKDFVPAPGRTVEVGLQFSF